MHRKTTVLALTALSLFVTYAVAGAAENRPPTPEEFKQILRQYNEAGQLRAPQRQQTPKGAEEFNRAIALQTKKGAAPAELKEAAKLYQTAVDAGIGPAGTNLALLYLDGKGVKKDVKKALSLLQFASKRNDSQADVVLARLHLIGKDVPRDEKKAEALLNKAVKTGNQNAATTLAEYREWKKKNEQATKQYQELLKSVKVAPGPGQPPQPFQIIPPAGPPASIPFPVIPGYDYVAGIKPPIPNFLAPASRPTALPAQSPQPFTIIPQGSTAVPIQPATDKK